MNGKSQTETTAFCESTVREWRCQRAVYWFASGWNLSDRGVMRGFTGLCGGAKVWTRVMAPLISTLFFSREVAILKETKIGEMMTTLSNDGEGPIVKINERFCKFTSLTHSRTQSIHLSIQSLSVRLSITPFRYSVHSSVYLKSVRPVIYKSIPQSLIIWLFSYLFNIYLSDHSFVCESIYPSIRPTNNLFLVCLIKFLISLTTWRHE